MIAACIEIFVSASRFFTQCQPRPSFSRPPTPQVPCLLSNWVEERSLAGLTGTHRLPTEETESFERTILHTEQQLPGDWQSTQRDYRGRYLEREPLKYAKGTLGPRARREEAELMATASTLPPAAEPGMDLHTMHRTSFVPHEVLPAEEVRTGPVDSIDGSFRRRPSNTTDAACAPSPSQRGRRVMKTRSGEPAVRDATFLVEANLMPAHQAYRGTVKGPLPTGNATLVTTGLTQRAEAFETLGFRRNGQFTRPVDAVNKMTVDGVFAAE